MSKASLRLLQSCCGLISVSPAASRWSSSAASGRSPAGLWVWAPPRTARPAAALRRCWRAAVAAAASAEAEAVDRAAPRSPSWRGCARGFRCAASSVAQVGAATAPAPFYAVATINLLAPSFHLGTFSPSFLLVVSCVTAACRGWVIA